PQTIRLRLRYAKAFEKKPGQNRVAIAAPKSPVHRWTVRVPQPGVQIQIEPMVALSDRSSTGNEQPPAPPISQVQALVGAADEVIISWTAQREGAIDMEALITSDATHQVLISDGVMRTRSTIQFSISRAPVAELTLQVPADHKIIHVYDPNIRKWSVREAEGAQLVRIELFEPVEGLQSVQLELEHFFDSSSGAAELDVPLVEAREVGRQQGAVLLALASDLRLEIISRTGLMQTDAADFPRSLQQMEWNQAYRYAAVPYALRLRVEKLHPRIRVRQLTELLVEPQGLRSTWSIALHIEDAGIFTLPLHIPDGWKVTAVRGEAIAEGQPASVKGFHGEPAEDGQQLMVALTGKGQGDLGLVVELEAPLPSDSDLNSAGSTAALQFRLPQVAAPEVERVDGWAVVYAPESLRVSSGELDGARSVAVSEALQELGSRAPTSNSPVRPILAVTHAARPAMLPLQAERRNPYVVVRQILMVDVEPGVAHFTNQLHYEIQYSSLESLRIDLPETIAALVQNASSTIRETPITPPPQDLADGYVAWEMRGESELIGPQTITLRWQTALPNLAVGERQRIDLPRIVPQGVERLSGQILIQRAETLDAIPSSDASGLRPIDPARDVWPEASQFAAARALEFYGPWTLGLELTRYELEDVKRTSIERAVARVVATRSGQLSYQLLYRLRSARQRLALQLPADAQFDADPVRIDGVPVELQKGQGGDYFIPLGGQDPDQAFVIELRYVREADTDQISLPVFPEEPAVQQVYLAIYLPKEWRPVHFQGPWTPEFTWRHSTNLALRPVPAVSERGLTNWVASDQKKSSIREFPTDGVMYLFSSLRPAPPPEGDLRLWIVNVYAWNGFWFTALVLIGLALMRASLATRLAAMVALLGLLLASGLVAPLLAAQWTDLPLALGVMLVGLAWFAQGAASGLQAVRRWRPPPDANPQPQHSDGVTEVPSPEGSAPGAGPVFEAEVHQSETGDGDESETETNSDAEDQGGRS
ncbi:MAG: hypothetical protein D6753_04155, partial [Planctomycetota bacterium]